MKLQGWEVAVEEAATVAEEHATATAVNSALSQAKKHSIYQTEAGRKVYQTILTAAVGPSEQPGGEESGKLSLKRRANGLGVGEKAVSDARARANRLRLDLILEEALRDGCFWYDKRSQRKDATSLELLTLMKEFWYTDGISRTSCKLGTYPKRHSRCIVIT